MCLYDHNNAANKYMKLYQIFLFVILNVWKKNFKNLLILFGDVPMNMQILEFAIWAFLVGYKKKRIRFSGNEQHV